MQIRKCCLSFSLWERIAIDVSNWTSLGKNLFCDFLTRFPFSNEAYFLFLVTRWTCPNSPNSRPRPRAPTGRPRWTRARSTSSSAVGRSAPSSACSPWPPCATWTAEFTWRSGGAKREWQDKGEWASTFFKEENGIPDRIGPKRCHQIDVRSPLGNLLWAIFQTFSTAFLLVKRKSFFFTPNWIMHHSIFISLLLQREWTF